METPLVTNETVTQADVEAKADADTETKNNDTRNKIAFTQNQQQEMNRILEEQKSKWEKDLQTKLDEAKTEAEKLAKMNAEQKAEYERNKREEELAKREGEITKRELRATALESLAEKSLPKQLADILSYTDAKSTNQSIAAVEKAFREAVEAGINERLKGDTPKGGSKSINAVTNTIEHIFAQR